MGISSSALGSGQLERFMATFKEGANRWVGGSCPVIALPTRFVIRSGGISGRRNFRDQGKRARECVYAFTKFDRTD